MTWLVSLDVVEILEAGAARQRSGHRALFRELFVGRTARKGGLSTGSTEPAERRGVCSHRRHPTFSLKSKGLLLLVDAHLGKRYGALSAFTAGTHRLLTSASRFKGI